MRKLIRADGSSMDLPKGMNMTRLKELIGAKSIDTVSMHHMGRPLHVLICDDNGWETKTVETDYGIELLPVRALKPINEEATRLYRLNCKPGTTHQIAGDVVVVPDEDFA